MAKTKVSTARVEIAKVPMFNFDGCARTPEFAAGVAELHEFLIALDADCAAHEVNLSAKEIDCAARHYERLCDGFAKGGEHASGFAAALAEWLVRACGEVGQSPDLWRPLERSPQCSEYDERERYEPPADHRLFDVAGEAASVGSDLAVYGYTRNDDGNENFRRISVELVRAVGKPISRARFDKLLGRGVPLDQ